MANIITLAEYRAYDDLPDPTENEAQIAVAITAATAFIEKRSGRVFEVADNPSPNDVVEVLDGKGQHRVYTRNAPVTSVTKLEYWDGTVWQEYDSVSYPYSFKSGSNIVYFTNGHLFYRGWQNVRATFEYGYTDALPDDLKLACYLVAKHFAMEAERLGINNQADGEQTFSYAHDVPKQALGIIARYRTVW